MPNTAEELRIKSTNQIERLLMSSTKQESSGFISAIPLIIILFPLLFSVFSFVFAQQPADDTAFLEMPAAQYTECVKETEYMRHHHWELLRAVREDVVRYGKRSDISLRKCRDCHTSREDFCMKCHTATSLTPDCFGCHYYP